MTVTYLLLWLLSLPVGWCTVHCHLTGDDIDSWMGKMLLVCYLAVAVSYILA